MIDNSQILAGVSPVSTLAEAVGHVPVNGSGGDAPAQTPAAEWQRRDVEWLLGCGRLEVRATRTGYNLMVAADDGRFLPLPSVGQSFVRSIIITALEDGAPYRCNPDPDDPPRKSFHHNQQVMGGLLDAQKRLPQLPSDAYNRRQAGTEAALPYDGGGAYHIRRRLFVSPEDLKDLRVSVRWQCAADIGQFGLWRAPEYEGDAGLRLAQDLLSEGSPLLSLVEVSAWSLVNVSKAVPCYSWDKSNTGKSTICRMMVAALGDGALTYKPSIKSLSTSNGFTPALEPLTASLLYILDESDKCRPIESSDLEAFVADTVGVHQKYETPVDLLRIAGGVMVGNDWPPFPYGATGVVGRTLPDGSYNPGRVDAAPILVEVEGADADAGARYLTSREHRMLMGSVPAIRYVHDLLLGLASEYAQAVYDGRASDFYDVCSEATRRRIDAGRAEMRELRDKAWADAAGSMEADYSAVLDDLEWTGNDTDRITTAQLLEAMGLESGKGKRLPNEFRKAWKAKYTGLGDSRFKTSRSHGVSVYKGWVLHSADDDAADAILAAAVASEQPAAAAAAAEQPGLEVC